MYICIVKNKNDDEKNPAPSFSNRYMELLE